MRRAGWLLSGLAVLAAASAVAQAPSSDFSSVERARLQNGELIAREVMRSEGRYHYIGGTSWQLVRAPVEQVWETVLDTNNDPRLIPSVETARVVSETEEQRVVHLTHRYSIASASYYARVTVEEDEHRLRFDLDRSRPHDLRAGRGFLSLRSYRGDTIVTWGALADLGSGMVMQVFGPMLHDWMLRVPRCVRDEIEPGHYNVC